MKTHHAVAVIAAIVGVGGAVFFMWPGTQAAPSDREGRVGGSVIGTGVAASATIHRVENGYEPHEVTIHQGETVSFVNESSDFHWPASDVHPTHSIYSEFDPREPIAPGETWSFTFDRAGAWEFHDHLRANFKGVITVLPVN